MARAALVVVTLTWLWPLCANAETTTKVYTYNADGALTSIQETSGGSSKTTYFTWDNFDAASGAGMAANGNLIGIGTMEGDDSIQSLQHDNLDRLIRVTNPQDMTAAVYEYHPDDLLAASLNADAPSTDGLQHYYDESGYPQVTNLYDRHTGELSSRHHRIRYLADGTEQMLVQHRKDVDGVYNLGQQTMSGYAYDPYGANLEQELMGAPPAGPLYSVRNNPYKYTHELRDPISKAYYLRARWYLPEHQTFLQRDPVANVNRYGYTDGNPINRTDASGQSWNSFSSSTGKFLSSLQGGKAGWISQMLLGPLLTVLSPLSKPSSFWRNRSKSIPFVVSLVAPMAITGFAETTVLDNWLRFSRDSRFGSLTRFLINAVSGSAGNALDSYDFDRHQFNWNKFGKSEGKLTLTSVFWEGAVGIGYRPFRLTAEDLTSFGSLEKDGEVRIPVFEMRRRVKGTPIKSASPLFDSFYGITLAQHHSELVIPNEDFDGFDSYSFGKRGVRKRTELTGKGQYRLLGYAKRTDITWAIEDNTLDLKAKDDGDEVVRMRIPYKHRRYFLFGTNCQRFVRRITTEANVK